MTGPSVYLFVCIISSLSHTFFFFFRVLRWPTDWVHQNLLFLNPLHTSFFLLPWHEFMGTIIFLSQWVTFTSSTNLLFICWFIYLKLLYGHPFYVPQFWVAHICKVPQNSKIRTQYSNYHSLIHQQIHFSAFNLTLSHCLVRARSRISNGLNKVSMLKIVKFGAGIATPSFFQFAFFLLNELQPQL